MINVLIVEDDPMVAKLNQKYVESVDGFNVKGTISNGEEALRFCQKNKVDLIILDIYMPRLDGISFLKELRKKFMMIDVILVTASKETQNIDAVLKLGAVDYLIKPFDYERLKNSLESYANRHRILCCTDTVKQDELDQITKSFDARNDTRLKKGLHKKTLERIRQFMKNNDKKYLSSEIIAEEMRLSKVTIRRYLEYMEEIGQIKLEVEYGSVGRPSHLYKYIGD
ncbi:response regulator [Wukongibacter sp. M2B1]|uniref:response regulator n=1 Tax=Wukongibacter sp. M2B1 TaxID=3088895 RepID=UPI003D7C1396